MKSATLIPVGSKVKFAYQGKELVGILKSRRNGPLVVVPRNPSPGASKDFYKVTERDLTRIV